MGDINAEEWGLTQQDIDKDKERGCMFYVNSSSTRFFSWSSAEGSKGNNKSENIKSLVRACPNKRPETIATLKTEQVDQNNEWAEAEMNMHNAFHEMDDVFKQVFGTSVSNHLPFMKGHLEAETPSLPAAPPAAAAVPKREQPRAISKKVPKMDGYSEGEGTEI
jgi:hypothetical protein